MKDRIHFAIFCPQSPVACKYYIYCSGNGVAKTAGKPVIR